MAELTPMMKQYMETKSQYQDCILFYRLGDFYEMFFDDALTASRELEITLTGKNCGQEERAPMCGVPYHAVEGYLNKLVSKGYKVAICEQVEDPKQAKGIVKREVVRIVTPGTNLDAQALDETKNNYIMCIVYIADRYGISVADISTGEYLVTELPDSSRLMDEISRFVPAEIICNEAFYMSGMDLDGLKDRFGVTIYSWSPGILMILCAGKNCWNISMYQASADWGWRIMTAGSSAQELFSSIYWKPRKILFRT